MPKPVIGLATTARPLTAQGIEVTEMEFLDDNLLMSNIAELQVKGGRKERNSNLRVNNPVVNWPLSQA